jgi:hypothetical protein
MDRDREREPTEDEWLRFAPYAVRREPPPAFSDPERLEHDLTGVVRVEQDGGPDARFTHEGAETREERGDALR